MSLSFIVGQTADVVMALDGDRGTADAKLDFDDVGIQGSLHQPLDFSVLVLETVRLFFKNGDELVADDLALALRIAHASELGEEAFGGVDGVDVEAELVAQALLHAWRTRSCAAHRC